MERVLNTSLARRRPALLLPLLLFFAPHLNGRPIPAIPAVPAVPDTHSSVQLIAEDQSIKPGRDFWVGLHFRIDPQWHIYWINPGDSGEPPRVEWDLPAGFRAGPIRWPYPARLDHPPLTDFGYEGEVLLMAPIHSPAKADASSTITLAANVKWLVCRDICIPAQQRLTLSISVKAGAQQPDPRWHALFSGMLARCPKPAPARWKVTARSSGEKFVLSIETETPESAATFFPLEPLQIEDSTAQGVSSFPRGVRLTLQKSEQLLKPITALKGVVVFSSGRAFLINAPVS